MKSKYDCCDTCDAYGPMSEERGACRAKAPATFIVGMQQGKVTLGNGQKQMVPVIVTAYPEVGKTGWCREYAQNPDLPHLEINKVA